MDTEHFINILQKIKSDQLFNPYTDVCTLDKPDAATIRTNNLRLLLNQIDNYKTIIFGEAPGHLGARKTGLAFTSEHLMPLIKEQYGLPGIKIATMAGHYKENSAKFVWDIIPKLKDKPFLWNIMPLHPFNSAPLTNRQPSPKELELAKEATTYLLDNTSFEKIIAVGRVAEKYLTKLGYNVTYIRHPSYGGSEIFKTQMFENFEQHAWQAWAEEFK